MGNSQMYAERCGSIYLSKAQCNLFADDFGNALHSHIELKMQTGAVDVCPCLRFIISGVIHLALAVGI